METLQRTANRGSVSTGGYEIGNSCKFEADNQEELLRTPSSASNMKTWTVSLWFKRTELDTYQMLFGSSDTYMYFDTSNNVTINFRGASENFFLITNRLFRDTSAFYHFVVVCDFTNSTAADRGRLYVNGVRETSYSNSTYQNAHSGVNSYWNSGVAQSIGGQNASTTFQSSGYMAEVHAVDGSALTADSFGEFDSDTGLWIPKEYDGSYGTNGFYLDYSSASDMGNDSSGNNNDFSPQNINQNDQATDTPTNNFATQNVIWGTDRMPLMSEGATEIGNNVNAYRYSPATIGVSKGKWYWEIKPTVDGNTLVSGAGIASNQTTLFFYDVTGNFVYHYDGDRYHNGTATSSYGAAWATNDIIGFAYDADNWTLTAYVNNSSQGNLLASQTDISSELFIPYVYSFGTHTYQTNFGGYTTMSNTHTNTDANGYGSFVYAPPSGYYALCTKNLAEFG